MRCYNCGSFLYENDFCSECGTDVSVYKKIVKKSNELYNRGLGYARDRNLSGAIQCLEVSIRMYKGNLNARNLLGLIYVESGEYAKGLAQWVISKSMAPDNNMAGYFLDLLQNNRHDLNLMNVTIRKYNKAVAYVQQENYDLAEIQLKKLLNDNPNMLAGHQLLSLILMRKGKLAEARVALRKAQKIDEGNPVTISYMSAVNDEMKNLEKDLTPAELRNKRAADHAAEADAEHTPLSGDDVIIPKSSYREYNPVTMAIIQILIGVIAGAAIIFFAVMPAKTRALRLEASETQAGLEARINSLEGELESARAEAEEAKTALEEEKKNAARNTARNTAGNTGTNTGTASSGEEEGGNETAPASHEDDIQSDMHILLISCQDAFDRGDYGNARQYLNQITDTSVFSESERNQYAKLVSDIDYAINYYTNASAMIQQGTDYYNAGNYQAAADILQQAYDVGADAPELLYLLGRSYDYLGEPEKCVKALKEFVNKYEGYTGTDIAHQILNGWASNGYN